MFNNEEEELFENNNNKYIMFSKDEKDIKIETTSCENEIKNEPQKEMNTGEINDIIPSLPYKSNIKEDENMDNESESKEKDEEQNNNDYDEEKMNIKNYLKDKIEEENIETDENNEKENNNNINNVNFDMKERINLTETYGNNDPNIKTNLTQVQITNSSISKGLKNVMINSTKSSIESLGNSIDNYIKMENLYLQDGKINTTTTNFDVSNTNNLTTNNNNNNISLKNSKNSYNKSNEMRNEHLQKKPKQKTEEEDIINNINNIKEEGNNNQKINEINIDINDNKENIIDTNLNINYGDLISEYQQKLREERANELKQKAKNKLRPKLYNEIFKKEYNNIVNKIYQELENQLKDELDKKMTDELNYIKKKENFNQKIKMEQIDNEVKEKVKNEFEEELNKELSLKEKEIKIKYNQKLENFKKKFRNELNEEYEKKKREMKNQLNDIKSKIYRSRCSEKVKINKINKMKKNIGDYNKKNNVGIKKIDKILGNESDEEENNPNQKEGIDDLLPFSIKDKFNNYEENQYNDREYDFYYDNNQNNEIKADKNKNHLNNNDNFNNDEQNNYNYNNSNNNFAFNQLDNDNKNSLKGRKIENNSVNLAELNKRIKESTDKISKNNFIDNEQRKEQKLQQFEYDANIEDINDIIYNYPQDENQEIIYDNKEENEIKDLNKNLRNKTDKESNIKQQSNNIKQIYSKPKADNKTNFNYQNNINQHINNYSNLNKYKKREMINKTYNDFEFDKNNNIFYSLQISPNIPTNISDFGKFLISHIEKEDNYKTLLYRELKSFKLKIKKIFSNSSDHCLTDYLLDIWEKIDVSFFIRYQILKNIVKLNANDLYMFLDRETEYLTNYFQISENIFENIKKRENIKAKLQAKSNRNETILQTDRDKLDEITQILEQDIKMFKEKYEGMNIVWKGIYYEWFMNYEKWFYEMEISFFGSLDVIAS